MIVDVHSHLMWYPDHVSDRYAQEALAAKLVKLELSGGRAHAGASLDLHVYDATPETHLEATRAADRVVVFGLRAAAVGVLVPNEVIADHVAAHPDRLVGWASVDPNDDDCIDQLSYAVEHLGLRGLKLGPTYQHFDPADRRHWPLYTRCRELDLPIMWHQGTTFPSQARLKWALPLQLEDVAMDFPELRMIIAHLGHPWEEDVVALIRECPNVFADISAVHYRPWRYWQAMVTAMEYGACGKLLLGSDFPSATTADVIAGLEHVNDPVEGTRLPQIPPEIRHRIVHENWKAFFPEWAE